MKSIIRFWSRKYNMSTNANSDFSTVTMNRVVIIFFEFGIVKTSYKNINHKTLDDYIFV